MNTAALPWSARAADALRALAARPALLLVLLLALNALTRPYANLAHDARLYSGQVLNQVKDGAYSDDLFFRYGSQDQFSVFSRLLAPLVAAAGVQVAFFGLYLIWNALFFLALSRFLFALVPNRVAAVLALVFAAVAPLSYSGLGVFVVHEQFFTSRIMATTLTLFALERLLRERYGQALALLFGAMLLHPLMAFGGLLVWAGDLAAKMLSRRLLLALLAGAGVLGSAVILYEPLGLRLFGEMDPAWREVVLAASPYNFPLEWNVADWINQAACFIVPIGALSLFAPGSREQRFLVVLTIAGAAGLMGTLVGSMTPYALLFQVQPYRVMWLLKVAQVGLAFALVLRGSRSTIAFEQLQALVILGCLLATNFMDIELALPFVFLLPVLLSVRGLGKEPRVANWLWRAGSFSLVLGALVWTVVKLVALSSRLEEMAVFSDDMNIPQRFIAMLGPVVWLFAIALIATWLRDAGWPVERTLWVAGGTALSLQLAFFLIPNSSAAREHFTRYGRDMDRARAYVQQHAPAGALPTVYSDLGAIDYLWVECQAKSYFDWAQVVGVLFNRQTALEGSRRARVVAPFELARFRESAKYLPDDVKQAVASLFARDLDAPLPTREDLARLCREPGLDFVITRQEISGVPVVRLGKLFVYDCRHVRAALGLPGPLDTAVALHPSHPSTPLR